MKKLSLFSLFAFLSVSLTSCEVIGDLMEASFWAGAIMVIVVIGIIIWLVSRVFGGKR